MNTAERVVTTLSNVIWPMQQISILSMLIQSAKDRGFPSLLRQYLERDRNHVTHRPAGLSQIEVEPLERELSLEYTVLAIGRKGERDLYRPGNSFYCQVANCLEARSRLLDLCGFVGDAGILFGIQPLIFALQMMIPHSNPRADCTGVDARNRRTAAQIGRVKFDRRLQPGKSSVDRPERPFNAKPDFCLRRIDIPIACKNHGREKYSRLHDKLSCFHRSQILLNKYACFFWNDIKKWAPQ